MDPTINPSTHFPRGPACAYGNRQHFCTDGRAKILSGFTVCFKRGLVFARRTTCTTGIDTLAHLLTLAERSCATATNTAAPLP